MLETECSISHPANSLSVTLEIFPLTQAERQKQNGASYCWDVPQRLCLRPKNSEKKKKTLITESFVLVFLDGFPALWMQVKTFN